MGAYIVISVLIFITCVLLILIILVQNSKGGGLASNFSSSNQYMGVRKTADFLEKTTWTLAIALLVLSMASILVIPRNKGEKTIDTELKGQMEKTQPVNYNPAPGKEQAPQAEPTQKQPTK